MAVLQPTHVDEHRRDQHDPEDGRVDRAGHRKRDQRIREDENDDGAEHGFGDRAAPAAERIAAEHDGGQRRDLHADTGIRSGAAEPRCIEESGKAAEHARPDVGVADRAPHADAGIVRGATRAADRHQPPAGPHAREYDMPQHGDNCGDEEAERNTENRAVADEVPDRRVGNIGDDGGREAGKHQLVDRAEDDQRHQRRKERTQPQIADQDAVDGAAHDAERETSDERRADAQVPDIHADRGGQHGQSEDRADGKIDAARQHHDRQPEHDQSGLGELPAEVSDVRNGIEVRQDSAEHDQDDDQRQERNGVVHPALGQQLADDVIGDEAVAKAN